MHIDTPTLYYKEASLPTKMAAKYVDSDSSFGFGIIISSGAEIRVGTRFFGGQAVVCSS